MLDNLNIRNDKYDQYLKNYYSEGPNYFKLRNNTVEKERYLCKFKSQTFADYYNCAANVKQLTMEDRLFHTIMKIEGNWYNYYKD